MGVFDDTLKAATAEDQAIFDKYPQLKASVEELESDLGIVARFAGQWVDWQNQNWDADAGMTRAEKALREELAATNAKLAAFEVGGGSHIKGTNDQALALPRLLGNQIGPRRGETMRLTAGYDKKTARRWVLRLEVPMTDFLTARFDDVERAIIADCGKFRKTSEVLLAAEIIARRIEENCVER
jgi:hypothetical protein